MKIKGLSRNYSPLDQPPEKALYNRNVILSNQTESAQNEKGFQRVEDYTHSNGIYGTHTIGDKIILFASSTGVLTDPQGVPGPQYNEFVELSEDGSTTSLFSDKDYDDSFNWSDEYPISAEHYVNPFGERVIAFIDGLNPPRIVNLDNPDVDDLNDTLLFPKVANYDVVTAEARETGGALESGAYYVVFRYEDADGTYTNWLSPLGPFFTTDESSIQPSKFDGAPAGTITNFSIVVALSNLDARYDLIRPGIIKKIGGVITAYELTPRSVGEDFTFIYTGAETQDETSLQLMLEGTSSYTNANAITQLNNKLYLANLETDLTVDLQAISTFIKVKWVEDRVVTPSSSRDHRLNVPEGWKHGEVYALYIEYLLGNGKFTRAFHIPGRVALSTDKTLVKIPGTTRYVPRFQYESTAKASGEMGYWENESERYPDDFPFPAYVGQPVRHHRMPDLAFGAAKNNGVNSLNKEFPVLDIEVSNVLTSASSNGLIQGWRISYAKKNSANSTVLGYDLPYTAGLNTTDRGGSPTGDNLFINTCGPWELWFKINTEGPDVASPDHFNLIGHNPFYLYTKASLASLALIRAHAVFELAEANFNKDYINYSSTGAIYARTGKNNDDEPSHGFFIVSHLNPDMTVNLLSGSDRTASVNTARFIAENIVTTGSSDIPGSTLQNLIGEELMHLQMNADSDNDLFDKIGYGTNLDSVFLQIAGGVKDHTDTKLYSGNMAIPLCSYEQILGDVHNSLFAQDLAITEGVHVENSAIISGADAKASIFSWQSSSPAEWAVPTLATAESTFRVIWSFIGESSFNWNMRHQEDGNPASFYYPRSEAADLFEDPDLSTAKFKYPLDQYSINQTVYNDDYTSINDIWPIILYDPTSRFAEDLPNTIVRSVTANRSSPFISWKTFLPSDAYVMPRFRGPIWNMESVENERLLVHCQDSLFITRDSSTIKGGQTNLSLGAQDIFDLQPMEVVTSTNGYGGISHRTFGALTKMGYIFIDDKQGKVFRYLGKLEELDGDHMSNFFRDHIVKLSAKQFSKTDPTGYSIDYDEYYDNLYIARVGDDGFCISFASDFNGFASFHDWMPQWMMSTRSNTNFSYVNINKEVSTFVIFTSAIYKHRSNLPGRYYAYDEDFGVTIAPFQIDMVFNFDKDKAKVFQTINWNTKVVEADVEIYNETFDQVAVYSFNKVSGWVNVVPKTGIIPNHNASRMETIWHFNEFRNIATGSKILGELSSNYEFLSTAINAQLPYYRRSRFIDKHIVVRLRYNNTAGKDFSFFGADAISRQSFR
jgi:hypothetical protein